MKFFNIIVMFGLMAFSVAVAASEGKEHNIHNSSDRHLHEAGKEERALTFLSNKVNFSGNRHWNWSEDSVLDHQEDIADMLDSREDLGRKFAVFNKEFEHNAHLYFSSSRHNGFNHTSHHEPRDSNWLGHSFDNRYCHPPVTVPVPEPETYAMLIAGLILIGSVKRRKG